MKQDLFALGRCLFIGILLPVCATGAEERIALLQAGGLSYTNVVITSKSATTVFFMHAAGAGQMKIDLLPPELQKKYGYEPSKAEAAERAQADAKKSGFQGWWAAMTKQPDPKAETIRPAEAVPANLPVGPGVGQKAPPIPVEKWLRPVPSNHGKFMFVDFWATWCPPCRASIPHLNALQRKFGSELVVVGLSNESEAEVLKLTTPKIEYYSAIDTAGRAAKDFKVQGIPHAFLIDPTGIIRWAGHPARMTESEMERLLAKHGR